MWRGYLTSRSSGRRLRPGLAAGSRGRAEPSSASISSHSAFSSSSSMRLSRILTSRMATDTRCAVSPWPPTRSAVRHSSSRARIESSFWSEFPTRTLSSPLCHPHRLEACPVQAQAAGHNLAYSSRRAAPIARGARRFECIDPCGRCRALPGDFVASPHTPVPTKELGVKPAPTNPPRLWTARNSAKLSAQRRAFYASGS